VLNKLLRGWFSEIAIEVQPRTATITARRHAGARGPGASSEVVIDRMA
jgi:hypothetical protein